MHISELFGLKVSPYELDFVDVDIDHDCPLFIDPFLISNINSQWAIQTDKIIKSFFNNFKNSMIKKDYSRAEELFLYMSEPKENCLGISKKGTTNGRGVGKLNTQKILNKIIESNAIEKNLVNNIEDLIIFVDDIDRDKLSDMVTNIIRKQLINYTKQQCSLWDIKLTRGETLPYWNISSKDWVYTEDDLLVIDGREILLIPKAIVSPIKCYNMTNYKSFHVVEKERQFHLERRSELVKMKTYKSGKIKYYLPKKDVNDYIGNKIQQGDYKNTKDYIRQYTQKHPDLFDEFINKNKKSSYSLSNEEIVEKISDMDINQIIDELIDQLKIIPTGRENASKYHHYVKSLLEILWYPYLTNPVIEKELHDGRKRIDIVMDNNANNGFFFEMHTVTKIFCPYIYIECKNYGKDIANPEIDQLCGRFSPGRGQFGLLVCRDIADKKLFLNRCIDTYKDNRGLVICLTDDDIILMLESIKMNNSENMWNILNNKKREIIIS